MNKNRQLNPQSAQIAQRSRAAMLALLIVLAALLGLCTGALSAPEPSPNLVLNSSFEFGPKSGGQPVSWEMTNLPQGGVFCRDLTVAHSGGASLKLTVPDATKLDWYQAVQEHSVRQVGQKFTLSVYIKAEGVHDGAGAYCSIGFYAADGNRISYADAEQKVSGTGEWIRQTTTGTVPDRAVTMKVICTLYGHGTVWFDDVQLEAGEAATQYRPSLADADTEATLAAQDSAAKAYRASHTMVRHPGLDVAILKDTMPAQGAASSPETLATVLRRAGFDVQFLSGVELANASLLSTDNFDLLILPYGAAFPAKATMALQNFLAGGGSFLSTGGYAFDAPMIQIDGKWYDQTRLPDVPGKNRTPVFDFSGETAAAGWTEGSFKPGTPTITIGQEGQRRFLQAQIGNLERWATIISPQVPGEKLPAGWSVTSFWAKGDANTKKLAVEWSEQDKSRWKTTIDLTPQWREYRIPHTTFAYWPDNPSVGRGGPTDHLRPESAAALQFGVSVEFAKDGGQYSFSIADIAVEDDPLRAERMSAVQINTRVGPIRDALFPRPEQIGVFDPSHPLEQVAYARSMGDQQIMPANIRLPKPFTGFAATAMLGLNGHGFGPDRARIIPLINCFDRFDRLRGALGSVVHNYTGLYQGSSWAIFGADNVDLFSSQSPQMLAALPQIARAVTRKFYLHGTEAEYACYRPGEPVKLQCDVSNFGTSPQEGRVRLEVRRAGSTKPLFSTMLPVSARVGETVHLSTMWRPAAGSDDICYIRATLLSDDGEIDREDNAVVLWNDAVARSGLAPTIEGTYFRIAGKPLFMMGNQNWWGQSGSVSARSPLKMLTDYAMMQDCGLHFSRCFLPWGDEYAKRISDAWVYLAQRQKIVLFHTPNLFNSMDNAVQAQQEKWAHEIAERYRDIPGLVVDISNEPYFVLNDDANLRARFNEYLKAKYGTDAALQAAWTLTPPEKPLPDVPCNTPSEKWADVRALDTNDFAMQRQAEWARSLRSQFRAADPQLPVSVGYMQGFGWRGSIWDPVNNSLDQDFTDRHYYGDLAPVPSEIKEIDLRWMGKPLTIGECGAKHHPSFDNGNMGEDPETYMRRFLYIGHHTFGMGGAFMASWHWRDPMEGIFPCGLVHADTVPRLARSAMRNMAILFSCMHPQYEAPKVFILLPDVHRMSAQRATVTRAVRRAIDLLLSLRVNFGTITEKSLDRLPQSAQVILYPIPYALNDGTFAALRSFVERGGKLYVSGDLSYDETFQRTQTDRLKSLCGVEFVSEAYPGIDFTDPRRPDTPVVPTTDALLDSRSGNVGAAASLPHFSGHPGLKLKAAGARVLADDDQRSPVVVANSLGKGSVYFVADPVELESQDTFPQRQLYEHFLSWAGVAYPRLEPDVETLHSFRLATEEDGEIHVLQNTGKATAARWTVGKTPVELSLAEGLPGLMWFNKAGGLLAVEGQGVARVGDRNLARFEGHFAALSLDDASLDRSQALLILLFSGGTVDLQSAMPSKQVLGDFGEIRQGVWRHLQAADVRMTGGRLRVNVPSEHRTSLLLIAPRDNFDTYSAALAAMVARR